MADEHRRRVRLRMRPASQFLSQSRTCEPTLLKPDRKQRKRLSVHLRRWNYTSPLQRRVAQLAPARMYGRAFGTLVARPDLLATLQGAIKEVASRGIGSHPVLPLQKAVDLIWQDHLFEGHVLRA